MVDVSFLASLQASGSIFTGFAWPSVHAALAPVHFLVRLSHVLAMGAFFGGIGMLDLRLMGWRGPVPLRTFVQNVLPWVWTMFAIAIGTGLLLFLYDPVHVGARAFFVPKMIAVSLGLLNAAWFHCAIERAMSQADLDAQPPRMARVAGFVSLVCWTSAVTCASLNVEAIPAGLLH